jgi:hypothetical protein
MGSIFAIIEVIGLVLEDIYDLMSIGCNHLFADGHSILGINYRQSSRSWDKD